MEDPGHDLEKQGRLIGDLRQVIENAEELLKNTGQYDSLPYQSARAKLAQALLAATDELERFEETQLDRMIQATQEANSRYNDLTGEAKVFRAFN